MSSKSTNRATLRAHSARLGVIANQGDESDDVDIAAATRAITETLAELYGGRVEDVAVEESDDEIVITSSEEVGYLSRKQVGEDNAEQSVWW